MLASIGQDIGPISYILLIDHPKLVLIDAHGGKTTTNCSAEG